MEGLDPANLRASIEELRSVVATFRNAHCTIETTISQLAAIKAKMDAAPVDAFWHTITTLSQLQEYFTRIDKQVVSGESHRKEVAILHELLPDDPVVYVDVGAGDALKNSNTLDFYRRGGHGLVIEPRPIKWYGFMVHRYRDKPWPHAVGDYEGMATMQLCDGASSIDPTWKTGKVPDMVLKVDRFQDILNLFPDIRDQCQLCTIDVEGFERRVLRSIDWSLFKPKVICAEYITFEPFESSASGDRSLEWKHILTDNGYEEHSRTELSAVYVLKEFPSPAPADVPPGSGTIELPPKKQRRSHGR